MEYSVYAHDVQHIILDNLQFMMGAAFKGFERFDAQEKALHEFRKFATAQNVHISVVIHPRKEPEDQALQMSSVFGTAKATQEADNVLIIQNAKDRGKVLEVKKNRFDGDLGHTFLQFDRERCRFVEVSQLGGGRDRGGSCRTCGEPHYPRPCAERERQSGRVVRQRRLEWGVVRRQQRRRRGKGLVEQEERVSVRPGQQPVEQRRRLRERRLLLVLHRPERRRGRSGE